MIRVIKPETKEGMAEFVFENPLGPRDHFDPTPIDLEEVSHRDRDGPWGSGIFVEDLQRLL